MRTQVNDNSVSLWLSANDTDNWASKPGAAWPCSQIAGHRLFAAFDRNGLYDMALDGETADVDANEFNAITSDFLAKKLPTDHPCYFVCVGQFLPTYENLGCEEPDEPTEPEHEDLVTNDREEFWCGGKLAFRVPEGEDIWTTIEEWCKRNHFYPSVWFISDHGNAQPMTRD